MNALCKDLLDALKEAMDSQTFMEDYEAWKSKNSKA